MKSLSNLEGVKVLDKKAQRSVTGGDIVCPEGLSMFCIDRDCICYCPDSLDDWVID